MLQTVAAGVFTTTCVPLIQAGRPITRKQSFFMTPCDFCKKAHDSKPTPPRLQKRGSAHRERDRTLQPHRFSSTRCDTGVTRRLLFVGSKVDFLEMSTRRFAPPYVTHSPATMFDVSMASFVRHGRTDGITAVSPYCHFENMDPYFLQHTRGQALSVVQLTTVASQSTHGTSS